jgi:hypothetical protein
MILSAYAANLFIRHSMFLCIIFPSETFYNFFSIKTQIARITLFPVKSHGHKIFLLSVLLKSLCLPMSFRHVN